MSKKMDDFEAICGSGFNDGQTDDYGLYCH